MTNDVFISYSRKDTKIANCICDAFDKAGITYFIDRKGIGGGMEFPTVLADAILGCKLVLFLASKNSYASKYTNNEVTFAFNKKPAGTIIPYIIDDSTLPPSLEFTFSSINIRTIKEHPIEPVLISDICTLLGHDYKSSGQLVDDSFSQNGINIYDNRKIIKIACLIFAAFSIVSILFFSGKCSIGNNLKQPESSAIIDSSASINDSLGIKLIDKKLEIKKYEREINKTEFLKIEYPINGNSELLLSIQKWIKETFDKMNIVYSGSLSNANSAVDFYASSLKKQFDLPDAYTYSLNIYRAFEDDKIVTFLFNFYLDESDYSEYAGATFRKTDGKIFTKDMIMQQAILPEIRRSFRLFYNAKSDEEFINIMNSEKQNSAPQLYLQDIRLPHTNPWITAEGFVFDYSSGEYRDYYVSEVGGTISFTIPSDRMKNYLDEEGKTFVE
jgi:hypothetical protein